MAPPTAKTPGADDGSHEQAAPREGASDSGSDSDDSDPERFEHGPRAPEAAPASSQSYAPFEGHKIHKQDVVRMLRAATPRQRLQHQSHLT